MKKTFNITGRCFPNEHFMADVSGKFQQTLEFIESKKYFSISRPRQFGKTTTLLELSQTLEKSDKYLVFIISFEGTDDQMFDDQKSFSAGFIRLLAKSIKTRHSDIAKKLYEAIETLNSFDDLSDFITDFVITVQKSVVVLIDEVDHSTNFEIFMRFLGMLRNKYLIRDLEATFHSVVLAGVHDIKSLKSKIRNEQDKKHNSPWNIATDFNVKMEFSEQEIIPMLQDFAKERQVTVDTEGVAKQLVFYTSGYPFLVSKLCKIFDEMILPSKNEKIWTVQDVDKTFQMILRESGNVNFDYVMKELNSNKTLFNLVYDIIFRSEAMYFNLDIPIFNLGSAYGILCPDENNNTVIHNRIYKERIANMMVGMVQLENSNLAYRFGRDTALSQYRKKDNSLNVELILQKFEEFMHEQRNAKDWDFIEREGRLIFLSFLRPILNGSGYDFKEVQISEERRLDIVITYFQYRYVVELKIWRGQKAHEDGLEQLDRYLDNLGLTEGYILIFDHNKKKRKKSQWINYNGKKLSQTFV
jgi:hypothetical protein